MEYTDLELNKMMAELEGWDSDYFYLKPLFLGKPYTRHQMYKAKSKLYDLMIKYKVEIQYDYETADTLGWVQIVINEEDPEVDVSFNLESEIPRAIIMCILKSENVI